MCISQSRSYNCVNRNLYHAIGARLLKSLCSFLYRMELALLEYGHSKDTICKNIDKIHEHDSTSLHRICPPSQNILIFEYSSVFSYLLKKCLMITKKQKVLHFVCMLSSFEKQLNFCRNFLSYQFGPLDFYFLVIWFEQYIDANENFWMFYNQFNCLCPTSLRYQTALYMYSKPFMVIVGIRNKKVIPRECIFVVLKYRIVIFKLKRVNDTAQCIKCIIDEQKGMYREQ